MSWNGLRTRGRGSRSPTDRGKTGGLAGVLQGMLCAGQAVTTCRSSPVTGSDSRETFLGSRSLSPVFGTPEARGWVGPGGSHPGFCTWRQTAGSAYVAHKKQNRPRGAVVRDAVRRRRSRYYLAAAAAEAASEAAEAAAEAAAAASAAAPAAASAAGAAAASAAGAAAASAAGAAAGAAASAAGAVASAAGAAGASSFFEQAARATASREAISRDFFICFP